MALEQLSILRVRREWVGAYQRLVMVGRGCEQVFVEVRCARKSPTSRKKREKWGTRARNGAPGREMRHPSLPF